MLVKGRLFFLVPNHLFTTPCSFPGSSSTPRNKLSGFLRHVHSLFGAMTSKVDCWGTNECESPEADPGGFAQLRGRIALSMGPRNCCGLWRVVETWRFSLSGHLHVSPTLFLSLKE